MSLEELRSRVEQSGAKMALIVSIRKGNPRTIKFLSAKDDDELELRVESAALRREVSNNKGPRIHSIYGVTVEENCSSSARELASILSSMLSVDVKDAPQPITLGVDGSGMAEIRVTDIHGGKLLWTFYHTRNGNELGPRIRISELRRSLS
jgi:rRNA maturation protein Rpf1